MGEGVRVSEPWGRGKGGGGAWSGMSGREGEWLAVADTVPQTWTNAARKTSARAASVPIPTALSSASALRDTAPAQTSPPVSVRGPPPPQPGQIPLPYLSPYLPPLCCFLLSPFLRLPPPPSDSTLPSLPPPPALLSLLATPLPPRRLTHLTAPPPHSDIDECRERGPALCGSQRCENSPGSYRCVRDCDPGYHAGPEGTCDGETTDPAPKKSFLDDQGGAPGFTYLSPHRCKQATSASLHCL